VASPAQTGGNPDALYAHIADKYGVTVIFHKSLMTATETSATWLPCSPQNPSSRWPQ
jgi:hypothetical protein